MFAATPRHGQGPHFVCIGPGNSATTWLADHLKLQRDIWMPPVQEASYLKTLLRPGADGLDLNLRWDWWSITKRLVRNRSVNAWRDEEYYEEARRLAAKPSNEPDLEGYHRLFAPAHGKLTGDIAPIYASFSVGQIRKVLPALMGSKIFMIARDPVQRFWSAISLHAFYQTFGEADYGSLEIAQRLFHDPERGLQHFPARILDRWEAVLGAGALKTFYFDDVIAQPRKLFGELLAYIGSSYRYRVPLVPVGYNRKASMPRVSPSHEAREWVRIAFQDELDKCAVRFGAYGEKWRERHSALRRGARQA